ncbi:MAG: 4-hydroxy-tetrahydrodipicolinate synthase [Candidatus Omnitrophica bacterium]|nr:4-hydroxy-tetrahydrodipicolinate synthase [Candidatus Omnitrophota bacterium]
MFRGSFVALVTPHKKDGEIDEKKFRKLIEFQLKNSTDGIVPCGCTGEAATLSYNEQMRLMDITVETVNGRIPVVAGAGSNCTEETIKLTRHARKAGCDGALLITPYYNKPTPEGQYRHYEKIAKTVDIPIMLYNVPSRTGISMKPETVARLSKIKNIVAIKEASGSLDQVSQILSLCDIAVLSGDDSLTLPIMSLGGQGVVSVAANIIPKEVHELVRQFLNRDIEGARNRHFKLMPLFKALFIETNPIPVKACMGIMKMYKPTWRLPLCEPMPETITKLKKVLKSQGLI